MLDTIDATDAVLLGELSNVRWFTVPGREGEYSLSPGEFWRFTDAWSPPEGALLVRHHRRPDVHLVAKPHPAGTFAARVARLVPRKRGSAA